MPVAVPEVLQQDFHSGEGLLAGVTSKFLPQDTVPGCLEIPTGVCR